MKRVHLALVASWSKGRLEHPTSSLEDVQRVWGLLTSAKPDGDPWVPVEAVWTVEVTT